MTPPRKTIRTMFEHASELAAILEAENEALAATDYGRAEHFAERKRKAIAGLGSASTVPPEMAEAMRALGEQLEGLIEANTLGLQRAIEVQGRVINAFARAISRCNALPQSYGGDGAFAKSAQRPVALISRA